MTKKINNVNYIENGEGFPVVMIHGLGGGSDTFDSLMPALSNFKVIRPELPGSGQSVIPDQPITIPSLADAIISLLRSLGIDRAHVVGHSLGTLVCQCIAEKEPTLVESLALFGALTEPPEGARAGLPVRAKSARDNGMSDIADAVSTGSTSKETQSTNPSAVDFVKASLNRQNPEGYALTCEGLAIAKASDWKRIKAPTMLVTGDSDPVSPIAMAEILNENIPTSKLIILEGCGHWPTVEKPQECVKHLSEFLANPS